MHPRKTAQVCQRRHETPVSIVLILRDLFLSRSLRLTRMRGHCGLSPSFFVSSSTQHLERLSLSQDQGTWSCAVRAVFGDRALVLAWPGAPTPKLKQTPNLMVEFAQVLYFTAAAWLRTPIRRASPHDLPLLFDGKSPLPPLYVPSILTVPRIHKNERRPRPY